MRGVHVQPRAAQLAALQSRHHVLGTHHAASGHIYQEGSRLHLGERQQALVGGLPLADDPDQPPGTGYGGYGRPTVASDEGPAHIEENAVERQGGEQFPEDIVNPFPEIAAAGAHLH